MTEAAHKILKRPRPWLGSDHLWTTIEMLGGVAAVKPLDDSRIMVDVAMAGHIPAYRAEGQHGSRVFALDDVLIRASALFSLIEGAWDYQKGDPRICGLHGETISGRHTASVVAALHEAINEWAREHDAELHCANDIWLNNKAHHVELDIIDRQRELDAAWERLANVEKEWDA